MSYTNLSPDDLIRIIEYRDLFVKEREVINLEEWEKLERQHEEDDDLESVSDEEVEDEEIEEFDDVEESKIDIPSHFEEFRRECKKYDLAPASFMREIGRKTVVNLNVRKMFIKSHIWLFFLTVLPIE